MCKCLADIMHVLFNIYFIYLFNMIMLSILFHLYKGIILSDTIKLIHTNTEIINTTGKLLCFLT